MTQDELKQAVARSAIEYVVDGEIIGVGTGSTANFFIDELARIKDRIKGTVASSEATAARLRGHGIEVFDLNDVTSIAVYIDGADEINAAGAMIKGGGAALTRVTVTAYTFDDKGSFLASARALIDVTALAPGDESPFVVSVPVTDTVARYRIGFRDEAGRVIAHVDKRRQASVAANW